MPHLLGRACVASALAFLIPFLALGPVRAAEATTGTISGTISDDERHPVANAQVTAVSPSARFEATSDAAGHFAMYGVAPDTYVVSARANGYDPLSRAGVTVVAGSRQVVVFQLVQQLKTIATVRASVRAFTAGSTSDTFTVSGANARAQAPSAGSAGLATYTRGTVQGAIAGVPGIEQDPFANAIVRGGKIDDAVFTYDSVPVPQGLVAEPGGNVVGAQLATTGIGETTVTLAGFTTQSDNALGGVINQIPLTGIYPGTTEIQTTTGIGTGNREVQLRSQWATPDRKWRYAFAGTAGSEDFLYGDGRSFYPAEIGTFGLALSTRAQWSLAGNVHYQVRPHDDLAFVALIGEATYNQYGTPFTGETYGFLNGSKTVFPGGQPPNAQVDTPSMIRGTYDVLKAQWSHARPKSLFRTQVYQSQFGAGANGPFWDDNAFPDGPISIYQRQGGRLTGIGADVQADAGDRHNIYYGVDYRSSTSWLDQIVPTADEFITSNPTIISTLAYLGDTWSMSPHFDLGVTLRAVHAGIARSDGPNYSVGALDPHLAFAYRFGDVYAFRTTYDRTTVVPKGLEVDRTDSANVDQNGNPAPTAELAPEAGDFFTYSLERSGATRARLTYFAQRETNRIDVLPYNFRQAIANGQTPNGLGVPTNAGTLRAHGLELWLQRAGFTFNADYIHALSSSASQFAYNELNAPATAAGHLFPVSYVPDFEASLSYEFRPARNLHVIPSLSYESGFPYGVGRKVWIFDSAGHPMQVDNDNNVNPGYNYYFLRDPSQPFNVATNPYTGSLGTPEGDDPNTLRTPPQMLLSLEARLDVRPRTSIVLDISNLLGAAAPTELTSNPYLIGPPGYTGGNPSYAAWYQQQLGASKPYTLGNGVPTANGSSQILPWTYGTAGYVPSSYPLARSVRLRLIFQL